MKQVPGGNADNLLQGQASGVTIVNSGQPGGYSDIKIRGITSLGNVTPLVIIDGVESINGLHDININDVESIQVLKDASAAIYGVQGSNGVLLITTKKGRAGKAKISYDFYYGNQKPVAGFKLANSQQYADVLFKQAYNSGQDPSTGLQAWFGTGDTTTRNSPVLPTYLLPAGAATADPTTYDINSNQITKADKVGNNWYNDIFKSAPIESHNLTASGGSDKSTYLFSFGYFNQQGTLINTYLKRYSVRANTAFNVKDNIRIGENAYVFFKDNPTITNQNEGNPISNAYRMPPVIPIYDIQGNYAGTKSFTVNNGDNPVASQKRQANNKGNDWQIVGNAWAEVDILKHFTARTSIGGTVDNYYYYYFTYTGYENAEGNTNANSFTEGSGFNSNWTWTNTLTYRNVFGDHSLTALAGVEAKEYSGRGMAGSRSSYVVTNPLNETVDPLTWTLDAGSPAGQTNTSNSYHSALYSQFGKVEYGYKDKYLVNATIRRDGSSDFAVGHQFGVFPAVTAAWRISREDFFKDVTFINDLKIRGGWGRSGTLSNVPATNQYNIYTAAAGQSYYDLGGTSTSATLGFFQSFQGNPNTTWETDITTDFGFDAALINNKLEISFDWYRKAVSGLLFQAPTYDVGFSGTEGDVNFGNVLNNGFDLSLTYHGTVNRDWKYNIGANISHYTNKITSLPGASGYRDYNSGGSTRINNFVREEIGHPIGAFFGYQVVGLFQSYDDVSKSPTQDQAAPGRFKYLDANHDNKITPDDRVFFGNPNPKLTYGIPVSVSYKNFDLSAFFYGVYGNDVLNYVKYWTDFPQVFEGNVSLDLVNNSAVLVNASGNPTNVNDPTAHVKNVGAKIPVIEQAANFSNSTVVNSYYKESGSYFRMKSLMIGYNVDPGILKKIGIDKFRIYVQGANLFTVTKYSGLDPELQTSSQNDNTNFGIDFGNYPSNQKQFLVGVNLTF
jgi:TonB-linked SusC/RagA family outer membrane protein